MAHRILASLLTRTLAALAIACAPLLGVALGRFAWTRGASLADPAATLDEAIAVGAAGLGALALALLTATTAVAALSPAHSRARAAALRAMPRAWRKLVVVTVTGAIGAGLGVPAAAAPGAGWLDPHAGTSADAHSLSASTPQARVKQLEDIPAHPDARQHVPDDPPTGAGWAVPQAPDGTTPGAAAPAASSAGPAPVPDVERVDAAAQQGAATVVVEHGDSLWAITARERGGTVATVAASWPDLYALNRDVVGPDPDLIHPGQRLALPAEWSR